MPPPPTWRPDDPRPLRRPAAGSPR
jgi:hypothetical protein